MLLFVLLQATAYVQVLGKSLMSVLMSSVEAYRIEAVIRVYLVYKSIWLNPVMEEELSCEREIGNAQDTHAVAIRKTIDGEVKTVGHVTCHVS